MDTAFYLAHLRPTYPSYRNQSSDLKGGNLPVSKLQMRTAFIRFKFSITHLLLDPKSVYLWEEYRNADLSSQHFQNNVR